MGAVLSSEHLTAPVTLNRVRLACQRDSQLPSNIRKHHAQLLANDLNKIGFKIPIKGPGGKEIPVDKLCEHMQDVIPNVSSVCMINKKNRENIGDAIKKIVHHFNKHYGSHIQMYKDPYAAKSKDNLRHYEDICDDLYMVEDRIRRQLTDNTNFVKSQLWTNIQLLQQYKNQIDGDFQKYFGRLQGSQMDSVNNRMHSAQALRNSMMTHLDGQLKKAEEGYKNMILAYNKQVDPLLGSTELHLDQYASTPFSLSGGNGLNVFGNKLTNLFVPAVLIGQAAEKCHDCINKFGITVDQFYNSVNDKFWQNIVEKKYYDAMYHAMSSGNGVNEIANINRCREALLHDKNYVDRCKRAIRGHSQFSEAQRQLAANSCDLRPESVCFKDNNCEWDKDKNICKKRPGKAATLVENWLHSLQTIQGWGNTTYEIESLKRGLGIPYILGPGMQSVLNLNSPFAGGKGRKSKRKTKRKSKASKRKSSKRRSSKRRSSTKRKNKASKRKSTKRKTHRKSKRSSAKRK